jgi:hypothetical protein
MRRWITSARTAACRATMSVRQRVCALRHGLMLALADPYRPERHYMRGPGPKHRARHGGGSVA